MFSLNEEQKKEIIINYGIKKNILQKIEIGLNETKLVKDSEDYYNLINEIAFEYISIKDIMRFSFEEPKKKYLSLSQIIVKELGYYYNYFENDKVEDKIKYQKILEMK